MELSERCRGCLEVAGKGAKPLSVSTIARLASVTRVKASPDDGGPPLLCKPCAGALAAATAFCRRVRAVDKRLKRLLTDVKSENDEPMDVEASIPSNSPPASPDTITPSSEAEIPLQAIERVPLTEPEPSKKRKRHNQTESKDFECETCNKRYASAFSLQKHEKLHKSSKNFTCDICGKQFKFRDNLKVHAMVHTGERPYACDLCDKKFSKKDNLAIHRKRHLKERNYNCDECGSAYYTSYELKTHKRVHSGEKPHVCTLCGKRFTARNNLYIHQRSHTGEKPHECTICGKRFTSKNILSIHSRIHTGEKPYICSVCGKRFAANKLAVHMRTHTGEKPHVCTLCGKQFAATNVLAIHMRRHTGEKPYKCKLCGLWYGHTQSLNKHMRRQHKITSDYTQGKTQQSKDEMKTKADGQIAKKTKPDEHGVEIDNDEILAQCKIESIHHTVEIVDLEILPSNDLEVISKEMIL